jgi:putative ABC transport system permease protein
VGTLKMNLGSIRQRLLRIFRYSPADEVEEELAFHLEERVQENIARGMPPEDAHVAALERFGERERIRSECIELLGAERRIQKRRERLRVSVLDLKLGLRMLVKYPGLTLVGGIAIAFAIWVGAAGYELMSQIVHPRLPLDQGDRVVGIRLAEDAGRPDAVWAFREVLLEGEGARSLTEIGGFQRVVRNLVVDGSRAGPIEVAEVTASAFRIARVPPLVGRTLVPADEIPGAPRVAVIGYGAWLNRFGGRPDAVGETVRLGREQVTVVGVMPEGFAFPATDDFWTPLRARELAGGAPEAAAGIQIFGRLAPGHGIAAARAEASTIASQIAAELDVAEPGLVAEVLPYPRMINNVTGAAGTIMMTAVNLFLLMLLVLACGNVALLMYARAASREGEIAVRSALGASRLRITSQLFVEALLLAGVAAAIGLLASRIALRSTLRMLAADSGALPFWFRAELSWQTIVYAIGLTLLAAAIAGILPALKVTNRELGGRLRRLGAGSGGYQFRGIWTVVIVAQVAVTLTFPALAFFAYRYVGEIRQMAVGIPSGEYLAARLELDPPAGALSSAAVSPGALADELNARAEELKRRLHSEPGVAAVAFASHLPRTLHAIDRIELDGWRLPGGETSARVGRAAVDVDYFDALGTPVVAGRGFGAADLSAAEAPPVIVNQALVDELLGGRNPVGMRMRVLSYRYDESGSPLMEPGVWREIVGVVANLGVLVGGMDPKEGAGFYTPARPGDLSTLRMAVHAPAVGSPLSLAPLVRSVASSVDPALRLEEVVPLDEAASHMWLEMQFFARLIAIASAVALLLSLAAIYSVTAFAVARRTREIGIRTALGAAPPRIVSAILVRPLVQVGIGVTIGMVAVALIALGFLSESLSLRQYALIAGYGVAMLAVCALACVVPTRRALRVQPTEALRANP